MTVTVTPSRLTSDQPGSGNISRRDGLVFHTEGSNIDFAFERTIIRSCLTMAPVVADLGSP